MSLRLGKLPDRTPVKLTIAVNPELHASLADYAAIYEATYGKKERVEDLAAVMLERFLNTDAGFKRARKELHLNQKEG
jgi:hypothetical protein